MESRLATSGPVRISAVSGTGEAVPIRVAAPRLGNAPPSLTRRPDVNPRERPSNRRQIASHVRKPRRPCLIPYRTPPPLRSEYPPRRSLDAQGRTPAGGQQGPRHFFGFFAPCAPRANNAKNCRRETSISTPDFASSLAGTAALHATRAAQGTPQGRASESKERDMNGMKEKAMGAVKAFLERKGCGVVDEA